MTTPCPRHPHCDHYVPSEGGPSPIAIIGEGPGATELEAKRPFVGPAGQLLDEQLTAAGILRTSVFLYNAVPCFGSPTPRTPSDKDIREWKPHLFATLARVRPSVIVATGNSALYALCGVKGISRLVNSPRRVQIDDGYAPWVVPTYHPAACLPFRDPEKLPVLRHGLEVAKQLAGLGSQQPWFPGYRLVQSEEDIREAIFVLSTAPTLVIDVESDGRPWAASSALILVGLGEPGQQPYVFPVGHPDVDGETQQRLKDALRTIFRDHTGVRVAYNGKFDWHFLRREGVVSDEDPGITRDPMLAAHLLDETRPDRGRLGLKDVGQDLFGIVSYWKVPVSVVKRLKKGEKTIELPLDALLKAGRAKEIPLETLAEYNARDVVLCGMVDQAVMADLEKDTALSAVYRTIVLPASKAMETLEANGIPVCRDRLDTLFAQYTKEREAILEELSAYQREGETINWASPKQVSDVLYVRLGLPVPHRSEKTDAPSSDSAALHVLHGRHPIIDALLRLRRVDKRLSKLKEIQDHIAQDGRLHPTMIISGPVTGRTASRNPNVQNLERGAGIRDVIAASPGHTLVEVDLSMIELRWAAHVYKEPTLTRMLMAGEDIHAYTASKAFGKHDVTDAERTLGKIANFLLIYGGKPSTLAVQLRDGGITPEVAAQAVRSMGVDLNDDDDPHEQLSFLLHRAFHLAYPQVAVAHEQIKKAARDNGLMVRTAFGRIRRLPDLNSPVYGLREEAGRQAVNAVVQGPASDTFLLGLIDVVTRVAPKFGAKVCNAVHDSLLAEVPEQHARAFAEETIQAMETVELSPFGITMQIPIVAEAKIGPSWGSMTKLRTQEVTMTDGAPNTGTQTEMSLFDHALHYLQRGWSVIPLTAPGLGYRGKEAGKAPAIEWEYYQTHRASLAQLRAWFGNGQVGTQHNVGIVTGAISKLVVVDVDSSKGGMDWIREEGISSTARVLTGGGGIHLYFSYDGPPLKNRVNLAPGVDIRAEGGQVAAPPSVHYSGRRYLWDTPDGRPPEEIPPLPPSLTRRLMEAEKLPPSPTEAPNGAGRALPQEQADAIVNFLAPYCVKGVRHDFHLALQGFLAKRNYRMSDVEYLVRRLMAISGDTDGHDERDRLRLLMDTYEAVRNGEVVAGSTALEDHIGKEGVAELIRLFGTVRQCGALEVLSATDFVHRELPKQVWAIDGLLPLGGLFILSGHPGAGKTTLALQIGMHLATGRPLLGTFNIPRAHRVVYIQADNPPSMMQLLLHDMLKRIPDAGENLFISNALSPIKLDKPDGFETMTQIIALYKPQVLILDTIRDFHSADENNPTTVAETIDTLKALKAKSDGPLTIGYIHHFSKSGFGERHAIERHMGSMRFVTPVDLSMALTFVPENPKKVRLSYPKIRWSAPKSSDILVRVGNWFEHAGTDPSY